MSAEVAALRRALLESHGAATGQLIPVQRDGWLVAERRSPTCGDAFTFSAAIDSSGRVTAVEWWGRGCTISTASADLIAEIAIGLSAEQMSDALAILNEVMEAAPDADVTSSIGALRRLGAGDAAEDIEALCGVARYPLRAGCARLAWQVLEDALDQA